MHVCKELWEELLETLDLAFYTSSRPTFYISICISTLPTQQTAYFIWTIPISTTL